MIYGLKFPKASYQRNHDSSSLCRYNRDQMEFKHLATKVSYRIEPNPAGGFIARSSDPSIPSIEAPTMEELQAKLQAQLLDTISGQFPGLKIPISIGKAAAAWGTSASRTLAITNSNGESVVNQQPSPEEVRQFAKQFAGIMQKDFPELAQELSAKAGSAVLSDSTSRRLIAQPTDPSVDSSANTGRDAFAQNQANSPIVPESNNAWKLVGICAVVLALVVVFFFYTHR